jgi:hypothetical protein
MKQSAHSFEDKLLEFAYGELPDHEARALEAHLSGCERCADALGSIRGVRKTMGHLPVEKAPDVGLESLLAYAEQAARRHAAGPAPKHIWWRRLVAPLAGLAALAVIGVVAIEASKTTDLSPSKADYDVSGAKNRREAPAPSAPVAAQVAPTQNDLEPAAAAPAVVAVQKTEAKQQKEFAAKEAQLAEARPAPKTGKVLEDRKGRAGDGWAEAEKKKSESAPADDALAAKDEAPAKAKMSKPVREEPEVDQVKAPAVVAGLSSNMGERGAGGLPTEEAADKEAPGRGPAPMAQLATPAPEPASPAPSMGLSLGGGRSSSKGVSSLGSVANAPAGGAASSAYRQAPPPPASRAVEPSRERAQAVAADVESRPSNKYDQADRDQQQAVELRGMLDQARRVSSSDRAEELRLAHQVLNRGAKGYQRLEALKRLCDGYDALGREDEATPFCQAVLREFPDSGAAKLVQQRLDRSRLGETSRAKAAKRSNSSETMFDDEAAKPAASPPAKAAEPASAY